MGNDVMVVHVDQRQDTTWLCTIRYGRSSSLPPDQLSWSFSYQSAGTRPLGPGTVSSTGRQSGGASSGPSA